MEFYIRRVEISPRSLPKVGHKANPTLFHPQFTNRVTRGIWSLASSFTSLPHSLSLPPTLSLFLWGTRIARKRFAPMNYTNRFYSRLRDEFLFPI